MYPRHDLFFMPLIQLAKMSAAFMLGKNGDGRVGELCSTTDRNFLVSPNPRISAIKVRAYEYISSRTSLTKGEKFVS